MFKEYFEKALRAVSDDFQPELVAARRQYADLVGDFFEDEDLYEERVMAFLEWFFFDVQLSTSRTPLEEYRATAAMTVDEAEYLNDVSQFVNGVFEVRKISARKELIVLRDLKDLKTYNVHERRTHIGFEKGDIIHARIFPHRGTWLFTDSVCAHPREACGVIRGAAKAMRKQGDADFTAWSMLLARKRWLLDRYHRAKPESVYRDDFAPGWFEPAAKG